MELDPIIIAIAGAALAAGLCVLALATSIGSKDQKAFTNRLIRVAGGKADVKNPTSAASIRTSDSDSEIKFLDTTR